MGVFFSMHNDKENIKEAVEAICDSIIDTHPDLDVVKKDATKLFLRDMSEFIAAANIDLPDQELIAIGSITKQKVLNN